MSSIIVKITDAERWLNKFGDKYANASAALVQRDLERDLDRLRADYPHVDIALTNKDRRIGMRRMFGDSSYCDMYMKNGQQVIECGELTKGLAGVAHNGDAIQNA